MDLAARAALRRRGGDAGELDDDVEERVDRADEMIDREPVESLRELMSMPAGVDRLIARWEELAEALDDDGAESWEDRCHAWLMNLLGHFAEAEPAAAGPLAADSHRLAVANARRVKRAGRDADLPAAEAAALVAPLRAGIDRELAALRALRRGPSASPAGDAVEDGDLKFPGVSRKVMLLHRYEMAHERSLRASIKDLVALGKARPDLGRAAVDNAEVISGKDVAPTTPETADRPGPETSAAPSEPERAGAVAASGGPRSGREGRPRRSRRSKKRRSTR
jgi:hypothetical protein